MLPSSEFRHFVGTALAAVRYRRSRYEFPKALLTEKSKPGSMNFCKVKASYSSDFYIRLPIAAPQCLKTLLEGRGNDLRSKTHEHALVQAPARLRANVPSCRLRAASYVLRRGVRGVSGRSPEFAFLLQAFSFSNKKKMPKRGKYESLIMVGREGRGKLPSIKYLYRLRRYRTAARAVPTNYR